MFFQAIPCMSSVCNSIRYEMTVKQWFKLYFNPTLGQLSTVKQDQPRLREQAVDLKINYLHTGNLEASPIFTGPWRIYQEKVFNQKNVVVF